jgi:hypothetical protein
VLVPAPDPPWLFTPGGHERWRVLSIAAGGRHSICLAIPVREHTPPVALGDSEGSDLDLDGISEPSLCGRWVGGAGGGVARPASEGWPLLTANASSYSTQPREVVWLCCHLNMPAGSARPWE